MPYVPSITETAKRLGDPAPNFRWVVAFPTLGTPVGSTLQGLTPVTQAPFGLVNRITFGMRTIDTEPRFAGGRKRNYPRWVSTPNVQITAYENKTYDMTQYLRSWSNLIMDNDNNFGMPSSYKLPIILYAYDIVSNSTPSMVGTLLGCWPPTQSGYEYGYDASGPITLSMDFCVDEDVVVVGNGQMSVNAFGDMVNGNIG